MQTTELLHRLAQKRIVGTLPEEVRNMAIDSRAV